MTRAVLFFLHRWLGLLVGIIVVIQGITGAIYCFKDELNDLFNKDYFIVQQLSKSYQYPSSIISVVQANFSGSNIQQINYIGPGRSVQVVLSDSSGTIRNVYVNPYDLRVLKEEVSQEEFFQVVRNLHMYMGFPPEIGKPLVGIANAIFLLLLVSGFYLFWTGKNRNQKGSFKIKWGANYKRLTYDLHRIIGFYGILFSLILSITGMIFSFEFMKKGVFQLLNAGQVSNKELLIKPQPTVINGAMDLKTSLDRAFQYVSYHSEGYPMVRMSLPLENSSFYRVRAYPRVQAFRQVDDYYFDLNAVLVEQSIDKEASIGKKFINSNYDIHTGLIWGGFGKILLFITSLSIASLPITGFIVWNPRKRKWSDTITKSKKSKKSLNPKTKK